MSFWRRLLRSETEHSSLLDRHMSRLEWRLVRIEKLLVNIVVKGNRTMSDIKNLESAVKADTDATNAALTLIKGIAAQLAAAQGDPAKVQALVDQLNANAAALSAAVAENTPAAPPAPAPAPAPTPDPAPPADPTPTP